MLVRAVHTKGGGGQAQTSLHKSWLEGIEEKNLFFSLPRHVNVESDTNEKSNLLFVANLRKTMLTFPLWSLPHDLSKQVHYLQPTVKFIAEVNRVAW